MKLRQKTITIMLITFLSLVVIFFMASKTIIVRSFLNLEEQDMTKDINRIVDIINYDINNLSLRNKDYAAWDQTYKFMLNRNEQYIKSELGNETFSNLKINIMFILDEKNNPIFVKGYSLEDKKEINLNKYEEELLYNIRKNFSMKEINTLGNIQGIIMIDKTPMMISMRRILTSDEKGPSRGIMVMGRYIDSEEINYIDKITHVSFEIDNTDNPNNYIGKEVVVKPVNMNIVSGYTVFKDIYGKPTFLIKHSMERNTFHKGLASVRYLGLSLIIIGGVFLYVVMIIIERLVLRRLLKLNNQVYNIGKEREFSLRVEDSGKDELASLAKAINFMLVTIEKSFVDLKENNEKLKELDKLKSDFISSVSHELRTPLTSIIGFSSLIKDKFNKRILPVLDVEDKKVRKASEQIVNNADIIISEGKRLTTIVNDVLDISKIEAGKMEYKDKITDVSEIIKKSAKAIESLINKNIELIVGIDNNLPFIMIDEDKLFQVLINLISNSIKFTKEGTITCTAGLENEHIIISVIDTGIGIDKKNYETIFERFNQVGNTLMGKPKGTGLGLPICKNIIEHYGGKIWVESKLTEGSKFSFTIPMNLFAD